MPDWSTELWFTVVSWFTINFNAALASSNFNCVTFFSSTASSIARPISPKSLTSSSIFFLKASIDSSLWSCSRKNYFQLSMRFCKPSIWKTKKSAISPLLVMHIQWCWLKHRFDECRWPTNGNEKVMWSI